MGTESLNVIDSRQLLVLVESLPAVCSSRRFNCIVNQWSYISGNKLCKQIQKFHDLTIIFHDLCYFLWLSRPEKWSYQIPRLGNGTPLIYVTNAVITNDNVCWQHHAIILARFFGRSGGGLCRLASARNASATRWECDWIIPFQPGVSITSVAWLNTWCTEMTALC